MLTTPTGKLILEKLLRTQWLIEFSECVGDFANQVGQVFIEDESLRGGVVYMSLQARKRFAEVSLTAKNSSPQNGHTKSHRLFCRGTMKWLPRIESFYRIGQLFGLEKIHGALHRGVPNRSVHYRFHFALGLLVRFCQKIVDHADCVLLASSNPKE